MLRILCIVAVIFLLISCNKTTDDISGTGQISGKIYVQNLYDSTIKTLLSNQAVFIREDTTLAATSFMYSVKSDSVGFFNFTNLNTKYYGMHADMVRNTRLDQNILFSADTVLMPGQNINFILSPNLRTQNALYIQCTDGLTPAGYIPNDSIYLYTSNLLAQSDVNVVGIGASYSIIAQTNGTAFKMNLPPTKNLYVNAAKAFGSLRLISKGNSISLDSFGLKTMTLKMQ